MAQELYDDRDSVGIQREVTHNLNHIAGIWPRDLILDMVPCDVGGVLLLHPFVVHATGRGRDGEGLLLRIVFNMSVK